MAVNIASFDIDTDKAQDAIAQLGKKMDGVSRSVKTTFLPLLTGTFLTGLFGGALLGSAINAGYATESMWRLNEAISKLTISFGSVLLQALEPVIAAVALLADTFNSLPSIVQKIIAWSLAIVLGFKAFTTAAKIAATVLGTIGRALTAGWVSGLNFAGVFHRIFSVITKVLPFLKGLSTPLGMLSMAFANITRAVGAFLNGLAYLLRLDFNNMFRSFLAALAQVRKAIPTITLLLRAFVAFIQGIRFPTIFTQLLKLAQLIRAVVLPIPAVISKIGQLLASIRTLRFPTTFAQLLRLARLITGVGLVIPDVITKIGQLLAAVRTLRFPTTFAQLLKLAQLIKAVRFPIPAVMVKIGQLLAKVKTLRFPTTFAQLIRLAILLKAVRFPIPLVITKIGELLSKIQTLRFPITFSHLSRLARLIRGIRLPVPAVVVQLGVLLVAVRKLLGPLWALISRAGTLITKIPLVSGVVRTLGGVLARFAGPLSIVFGIFDTLKDVVKNTEENLAILKDVFGQSYGPMGRVAAAGLAIWGVLTPLTGIIQQLFQYFASGGWRAWGDTLYDYVLNPLFAMEDVLNAAVWQLSNFMRLANEIPGVDFHIPTLDFGERPSERRARRSSGSYSGNYDYANEIYGTNASGTQTININFNAENIFGTSEIGEVVNRVIRETKERGGYTGVFP